MPLFFNAESHLWIAYLFFVNGVILCLLLRAFFDKFSELTQTFESVIAFGFVLSISINGVILFALDKLNVEFSKALLGLSVISLLSTMLLVWQWSRQRGVVTLSLQWSYSRVLFYGLIFIILFYNGGMIDQLSDAWWHMSFVNKISMANSFTPDLGHLTSAPVRYYPPLWHGNLALAHIASGETIPVLWNSATAWVAVVKVMAFYCFALALSQNNKVALGAAILFVLLPGIGNAYLRVSAWPSHIAFTVWYLMLAVFMVTANNMPEEVHKSIKRQPLKSFRDAFSLHWLNVMILIGLAAVIYVTHQTELLWFCVAVFAYFWVSSVSRSLQTRGEYFAYRDHSSLRLAYRFMLLILIAIASNFAKQNMVSISLDQMLALILPIVLLLVMVVIELDFMPRKLKVVLMLSSLIIVFASLNFTHLASLFFPEMSVPRGMFHESPSAVIGYFGGALDLPGWHLQLRAGLLYSGIIAVPLSVLLVILKPSSTSLFICGTAVMALLFCLSPYLYHWLKGILSYHSPWRMAALIFHPIVLAVCVIELVDFYRGGRSRESISK